VKQVEEGTFSSLVTTYYVRSMCNAYVSIQLSMK